MKKFIALHLVIALAIGGLSLTGCCSAQPVSQAALGGKAEAPAAEAPAAEAPAAAEEKAEEKEAE
jgi:hypothetical protein